MPRTLTRSVCLDAALDYLRRGWAPVPLCPPDHANCRTSHVDGCQSPGKRPLLLNWRTVEMTAEKLQAVWQTNPSANVGVLMGSASDLCCIDIDGDAGYTFFESLCRDHGEAGLPDTLQFKTGKGLRLLFSLPEGMDPPYRKWVDEQGDELVSFLQEGRQTVMPPSRHANGQEYEWIEGCRPGEAELAPLPLWLYQVLVAPKDAPRPAEELPSPGPARERPTPSLRARAFARKCDPAISGSNGHGQTFKVACKLVHGFGLSDGEALAILLDEFNPRCQPPWSVRELEHKVESARAKGTSADLLSVPGRHDLPPPPPPESTAPAASEDPDDEQDATDEDLIEMGATIEWLWTGWIPVGVLTCLAAAPGVGKTRFCADLFRRLHLGLPMPDGSLANLEPGRKVLWVASDNQHPELSSFADEFGFPRGNIVLNTPKRQPYGGAMLDTEEEVRDFERRIRRVKPCIVFIDTSLNSTNKGANKPEEAKAFFVPLQGVAQRTRTPIVCVTHLNTDGKPLGKRIEGQVRVVMQLEKPDPDQEKRRKLYVVKSFDLFPPPLGVTMHDAGNDYDSSPPLKPDDEPGKGTTSGAKGQAGRKAADWLRDNLPGRVFVLRKEWEAAGHASSTIYKARDELGIIEDEIDGKKHWSLPTS